jgi:hypothetical protein
MISQEQKQQAVRQVSDAQTHARRIVARCGAGLVAVVLLVKIGTLEVPAGRDADTRTRPVIGNTEELRRESFEARRAYYEAEQQRTIPRRSASR